jgi:hypothetical protein
MRPQSCKAKGRRLQQMIVSDLLELFPHLTSDDVRSTSMGANGEDVQLSAAARIAIPFSIEAKNQEKLNIWNALEQAKANAPSGCTPLLVMKKNGSKPYAVISWDAFRMLIAPETKTLAPREMLMDLASQLQNIASTMDVPSGS